MNTVTLDHDGCVAESDLAKGYALGEPDEIEFWVPKSLIQDEDDASVEVPEWWAEKEGHI